MNKKVSVIAVALMAIAMLAIPIVQAFPLKEKNNGKFQEIVLYGEFNFLQVIMSTDKEYIPSFDVVNKFITNANPKYYLYTITVDGTTYTQGVDFDYVPISAKYVYFDPVFKDPDTKKFLVSSRMDQLTVEWMFDFSKYPDGIEGTLMMQCIEKQGYCWTNSLAGTDDLRNVQIKAAPSAGVVSGLLAWARHDGTVIGWPE